MEDPDQQDSIYQAAKAAIDEEELARAMELAAGEECEEQAVAAMQEVVAETAVADIRAAVDHARRRGRTPTGDDVATAAEKRFGEFVPLHGRAEW